MYTLSALANIAEIFGALFVIGGIFFAMIQMRHLRQQRRELAAIELFRSFDNPEFAKSYQMILLLPDELSAEELRKRGPSVEDAAMLIGNTMESIGVMTFHRIVPFHVVCDLTGASAIILWRKLRHWVQALRDDIPEPATFEWFQWLVDRLEQHPATGGLVAHEAHRDWKPMRRRHEV